MVVSQEAAKFESVTVVDGGFSRTHRGPLLGEEERSAQPSCVPANFVGSENTFARSWPSPTATVSTDRDFFAAHTDPIACPAAHRSASDKLSGDPLSTCVNETRNAGPRFCYQYSWRTLRSLRTRPEKSHPRPIQTRNSQRRPRTNLLGAGSSHIVEVSDGSLQALGDLFRFLKLTVESPGSLLPVERNLDVRLDRFSFKHPTRPCTIVPRGKRQTISVPNFYGSG